MKRNLSIFLLFVLMQSGFAQLYVPEKSNSYVKVKPVVPIKAYSFHLNDVEILESDFKKAMESDIRYLKLLEPDRLLSQFRSHSGLEPKADKYGGWESSGLAGHTLGHYLSACAMHYAVTKDQEFLQRVNYIVDELELCQKARKTGYTGAIPKEDTIFLEVSQGNIRSRGFDLNGAWSPWYTIHKVMAGLLDAYLYCNNEKALQIEQGIADWTGEILKNLNDEQIQKMLLCEYGGMNEVLVNTYAFTGIKKYLDLSYIFHDKRILDSLAMQVDVLPGKHSNTQIPKAIGTVRRYEVTGEKKDFIIGDFLWRTIVNHHTYAPGGNSNYEYLGKPDELNGKLTDNTMETCNTYNMLKLTRHLFAINPSAHFFDFYERALYNHILASQNQSNGMMCYFVPLRMGTRKQFSNEYHSFTCCVGSGMENHVKYGESIYYQGADGNLLVNLFIPSRLCWKEKELTVTMKPDFLKEQRTTLLINAKKTQTFAVFLRKPYWISGIMQVKVNGAIINASEASSYPGYISINRKWKDGDVIELSLPMNIHAMAMPDNKDRSAFFFGPLLLAGNLGEKEPDPMNGVPVFVTDKQKPDQWIKQQAGSLIFKTNDVGVPADVALKPFYTLHDEYYNVYWDVFSPEQWKAQQEIYQENKRAEQELEVRTVDQLRVGEMQPERDHNLVGDKTEAGESHTRKFRTAHNGGYVAFTMKVLPDVEHTLICTYWGMDNRGRTFDILIDGEKIATEDINKYKESRFYDISYSIPKDLTKGKNIITVKFQAKDKNQVGPVYGVRLVKDEKVMADSK